MIAKLFEVRDRATCIPVMAVRLFSSVHTEVFLLRRAGYGHEQITTPDTAEPYVILTKLDGTESQYDPFAWTHGRTLQVAHRYMIDHWSTLQSGDVVDVEFILGESTSPKTSERLQTGIDG